MKLGKLFYLLLFIFVSGCATAAGLRDLGAVRRPDGTILHAAVAKNEGFSGPDAITMIISECDPKCRVARTDSYGAVGLAEAALQGIGAAGMLAAGAVGASAVRSPDKNITNVNQGQGQGQVQGQGQHAQQAQGSQFQQKQLTGQGSNFQVQDH